MPNLFRLLSDSIESLPDWQENVIASLIVAALLGAFPLYQAISKRLERRKERIRLALEAKAEADAAKRREFDNFPAELGFLDHGENTSKALEAIQEQVKLAVPPTTTIIKTLLTKSKKPQIADELRDDVLRLEEAAASIRTATDTWIGSWRAVFASPYVVNATNEQLRTLAVVYRGGVADTFQQLTEQFSLRRRDVLRFGGQRQATNRIVARTATAMASVASSTNDINEFCLVGMNDLATAVLTQRGALDSADADGDASSGGT
jgi:hypothetical protein